MLKISVLCGLYALVVELTSQPNYCFTDSPLSWFCVIRIFAFAGMTLVLWSPVAIPLLPTFLQSWTTNTPSRIADLACIIGLYTAFMILVTLWGKRIRGYEDPLTEYGLDLMSLPKVWFALYIFPMALGQLNSQYSICL